MPETITASTSAFAIALDHPKNLSSWAKPEPARPPCLAATPCMELDQYSLTASTTRTSSMFLRNTGKMIPGPEKFDKEYQIPYRCYFHPKTKALIVRVNYFIEKDYNEPTAWLDFTLYHTFFAKQAHDLKAAGKPQRWEHGRL